MNNTPVHGVPGEDEPRRNTLGDDNENGGVGSNHDANFTVNSQTWKGAFARRPAMGGVL